MCRNNIRQSLRKEFATESLFLRDISHKITNGVLCDTVYRHNSRILCLKSGIQFHGKHVNMISFTPTGRAKVFPLTIFTELINGQHCTCRNSTSNFTRIGHQMWRIWTEEIKPPNKVWHSLCRFKKIYIYNQPVYFCGHSLYQNLDPRKCSNTPACKYSFYRSDFRETDK